MYILCVLVYKRTLPFRHCWKHDFLYLPITGETPMSMLENGGSLGMAISRCRGWPAPPPASSGSSG